MHRLKTALATGVAVTVGLLAVRKFRERRRTPRQEAAEATRDALEEGALAARHAVAAAGHARVAGQKATETARGELRERRAGERVAEAADDTGADSGCRLRRVGSTRIRR